MEEVAHCLRQWGLEQYIENFDRKGYDRLDYFMDLSPTKIREHTVSLEMKEGHAERFLKEIKNRKKFISRRRLFTPPVVRAPVTVRVRDPVAGVYALPDKLYSAQEVTEAIRRHSTSLRCRALTYNKKCGTKTKVFKFVTAVHKKVSADGFECPYQVIWRVKEATAFCSAKFEWTLDRTNSVLYHKPMCDSGIFMSTRTKKVITQTHIPTHSHACPCVPKRA